LVVILIPILALGAYRVYPTGEGGWYFLGKVPLSPAARWFNYSVGLAVLTLLCYFGLYQYTNSPGYKASQMVARADSLIEQGQSGQAAELYREVMAGKTEHADSARQKLSTLVESPPGTAAESARVFRVALDLHRQNDKLVPDLFQLGIDTAKNKGGEDPQGALEIVEVVAPLAARPQDHLTPRRALLEKLVERQPDDVELACRLAVVYESLDERGRCEKLLVPHEKQLGAREGAAILGRIWVAQGKHERAFALLEPYVEGRLQSLHRAEESYQSTVQARHNAIVADLRQNNAVGFDYEQFKRTNEAQRREMVQSYIDSKMRDDPQIRAVSNELSAQAKAIPAILDLGMVRLHRAQAMNNPAARKAELEAAEKTFLSIKGLAGESDRYRLYLGQVQYWLGKHTEGKKLFDDLLAAQKRSTEMLLMVANTLREIGSTSEARKLAEEAYTKESDSAKKHQAATVRALLWTDLDDQITWLERSDPNNRQNQASLAEVRGHKALQDNKNSDAAREFRRAIELYAKMTETSASLNNSALAYFGLFRATHDREQFTQGIDRLERAIALLPGDSILLSNASKIVLENTLLDFIGEQIDLKTLDRSAGLDLLAYLYNDDAGRRKLAEKLGKHPGLVKVRTHLNRLLVVAPAQTGSYSLLAQICEMLGDEDGLRGIQQRLEKVQLDRDQYKRELFDYYTGKRDEKYRSDGKKALAHQEASLKSARKKGGVTQAVALAQLVYQRISMAALIEVNPNSLVQLAEEANKAALSNATRSALISALSFRAHQTMKKTDPSYAALAKKVERSLSYALLGYILAGPKNKLRDKLAANADVVRVGKLTVQRLAKESQEVGPTTWAWLRTIDPAKADKLAKQISADSLAARKRSIDRTLSPLSGGSILETYWMARIAGKDKEAEEVLRQAAKRGVPMPAMP
jgi:hypothetical protein